MNCSCRTAALRIFVNNIAHINVPTIVASARLASRNPTSNPLRSLRSLDQYASAPPIPASRSLHTTPYRSNKVEAVIGDMRLKPEKNMIDNSHEFTRTDEAPRKPRKTSAAGADDKRPGKPFGKPPGRRPGKPPANLKWNGRPGGKYAGKPDRRPAKDSVPPEEDPDKPFYKPSLHQLRIEEQDEQGLIRSRTDWRAQKAALKEKFPEGWKPRKKLSPDALVGIRALHAEFPDIYTTEELANKFEVSPENIRRILRSKWVPTVDEEIERQERWFNRGKQVWARWAEIGKKPPRRWRAEGIVRDPIWNEKRGEGGRQTERGRAAEAHKKLSDGFL